jgi:hypothetical protein
VVVRNPLGHEAIGMTTRFVGLDSDKMATWAERVERAMRESLTVP